MRATLRIFSILASFLILAACTHNPVQETSYTEPQQLMRFEVGEPSSNDDSFGRWQLYNERRMSIDKWEALVDEEKHEIKVDVDVDNFVCGKADVEVHVTNLGDVDEVVRIELSSELLNSNKVIEVEKGHKRSLKFFNQESLPQGSYKIEAKAFRTDYDFSNEEYEGSDAETVYIASCE